MWKNLFKKNNKFIHKKTNILVAQIRDTNHANEIKESLSKILRTGKTEKDFFKEGKLEGKQEIILTLLKKGYNANQIADLLNLNQPFVEKFIQKKNNLNIIKFLIISLL